MFYVIEARVVKKNIFDTPEKTARKITTPSNIRIFDSALIMVESDHRPTLHEVKEKIRKNDFVLCGRPNWLEKNFQIVRIGTKIEQINHCPFMRIVTEKNLIGCGEPLPKTLDCMEKIGCTAEKCVLKSGNAPNEKCFDLLKENSEIIPPWFLNSQEKKRQRT
ncbi:MAG: hypothetical protein WC427_01530 [Candidatus Paceibacterota bacterium]|jgi:hypothetical protein